MKHPDSWRQCAPGLYLEGETLHLDVDELLTVNGYPVTEHNVEMLSIAATKALSAKFPGVPIHVVTEKPGDEGAVH